VNTATPDDDPRGTDEVCILEDVKLSVESLAVLVGLEFRGLVNDDWEGDPALGAGTDDAETDVAWEEVMVAWPKAEPELPAVGTVATGEDEALPVEEVAHPLDDERELPRLVDCDCAEGLGILMDEGFMSVDVIPVWPRSKPVLLVLGRVATDDDEALPVNESVRPFDAEREVTRLVDWGANTGTGLLLDWLCPPVDDVIITVLVALSSPLLPVNPVATDDTEGLPVDVSSWACNAEVVVLTDKVEDFELDTETLLRPLSADEDEPKLDLWVVVNEVAAPEGE
jgi:hypothetical protein